MIIKTWACILTIVLIGFVASTVSATDVQRITIDQLKAQLNDKNVIILDVRGPWDWDKADEKIAGAVRVDSANVSQWAGDFEMEDKTILYCT